MKRLLFFSIFIIISFNLFSQHLLDSLLESIKYPKVPENKALVYFIRNKVSINYVENFQPITVSVILSKDTCLLATLIAKNYNYTLMDPGEYEFLVSDGAVRGNDKDKININLESDNKYYINVEFHLHSSINIEEKEIGNKKLSGSRLSTHSPWVAVFYDIDEKIFSESHGKEKEKVFFDRFLEKSKYVIGQLIGVSEESYFLYSNGKIIEVDNLECKSIYFFKNIPTFSPSELEEIGYYYRTHILLSAKNGKTIGDGLLFQREEFLEHIYFYQTFFNYSASLYSIDNLYKINTNKDFQKIDSLLHN